MNSFNRPRHLDAVKEGIVKNPICVFSPIKKTKIETSTLGIIVPAGFWVPDKGGLKQLSEDHYVALNSAFCPERRLVLHPKQHGKKGRVFFCPREIVLREILD